MLEFFFYIKQQNEFNIISIVAPITANRFAAVAIITNDSKFILNDEEYAFYLAHCNQTLCIVSFGNHNPMLSAH